MIRDFNIFARTINQKKIFSQRPDSATPRSAKSRHYGKYQEVVQQLLDYYDVKKSCSRRLKVGEIKEFEKFSDAHFLLFHANKHYLLTDAKGNSYYIKTALHNLCYLRESILNELFVYKILECLGYGPVADAFFALERRTLHIVTHDLNNKEEDEDHVSFKTADDKSTHIESQSTEWQEDLFRFNFLADLLELTDVEENKSNYGLRTSGKRKTMKDGSIQFKIQQKPMIIDFLLMRCGSNLDPKRIIKKYSSLNSDDKDFLFDVDPTKLNKELLQGMIDKLDKRSPRGQELSFGESIEIAFEFTKSFHKEFVTSSRLSRPKTYYQIEPVVELKRHYLDKWKKLSLLHKS